MRRTSLISALIGCFALMAVIAPMAAAKDGGGVRRTIGLHGSVSFPGATGHASSKTSSEERELEVEVQHVRALAGKRVNVFVNGTKWTSPRVSSLGAFHVERQHAARAARAAHHEQLDRARPHAGRHPDRKRQLLAATFPRGGWATVRPPRFWLQPPLMAAITSTREPSSILVSSPARSRSTNTLMWRRSCGPGSHSRSRIPGQR